MLWWRILLIVSVVLVLSSCAGRANPAPLADRGQLETPTLVPAEIPGTLIFEVQEPMTAPAETWAWTARRMGRVDFPEGLILKTLAPDGRRAILSSRGPHYRYSLLEIATRNLAPLDFPCTSFTDCGFAFSPAGTMASVSDMCGLDHAFLLTLPATELITASARPAPCLAGPGWPQGWINDDQILLRTPKGPIETYRPSTQQKSVLIDGAWKTLSLSVDGAMILAGQCDQSTRCEAFTLAAITTDSADVIPVPIGQHAADAAVISPDHRYVVFSARQSADSSDCLYLVDLREPAPELPCLVHGLRPLIWLAGTPLEAYLK